jgi:hypothetical protein
MYKTLIFSVLAPQAHRTEHRSIAFHNKLDTVLNFTEHEMIREMQHGEHKATALDALDVNIESQLSMHKLSTHLASSDEC